MTISIERQEVLRYLGYRDQEIDKNTSNLIGQAIEEIKKNMEVKTIHREVGLSKEDKEIRVDNGSFSLEGQSIAKHLKDSPSCILMALTLGHEIDRLVRYYERLDMAKAIVLDAAASAAIEEVADQLCQDLAREYASQGKRLTRRFSPGYGDLDIGIQGDFLNLLKAGRTIGLTATSHHILIPRKSVTAIVGITDRKIDAKGTACRTCNKYPACNFTKGGRKDGN